jgi:hypothetical protein
MTRTQHLFPLCLFLLLGGCGDDMMYGPDAPPAPPDAGVVPPDAEPPDAIAPPTDAEPCRYLPESTETTMPNYPIRFSAGKGLEESPDLRQDGLLELLNADLSNRDVIEKRRGAAQLGDTRSATPGDVVPDADRIAIWAKGDEVLLETRDAIYKEQRAVTTFTWLRAASWIRMRLREAYANTFTADVLSADYAVLGDATLVAYQLTGGTVQLVVYGPSMAREVLQSFATSERPRLTHEGDRVRLTYRDTAGNSLFSGTYASGAASITMANTGFGVTAAQEWDVSSKRLDTGNRVSIFVREDAAPNVLVNVIADTRTGTHTIITGYTSISDVNVSIWPMEVTGDIRYVVTFAGVVGGTNNGQTYTFELPIAAGPVVQLSNLRTTMTAATFSCAASWEAVDKAWVAIEETSGTTRRVAYARGDLTVALGFTVAGTIHESTSLVGQGAIIAGTPTNATSPADLLSPGFVEQLLGANLLNRSGWIVFAPRTGEIVARSFVGFTGDLGTRTARPPKGSFIAEGNTITWAGAAAIPSDPSTTLRAIAICKLDRTARANKPAQLDGIAISAHAGYPRAYDGTRAFEHDWHSLPRITGLSTVAGAGIGAGTYNFAATWEAEDANGLRYRSAPDFLTGFIVAAPIASFNVTLGDAMSHTERSGVRVVIWRVSANGATYRRAAEAAVTGLPGQVVNLAISDATLSTRETLDQAPVPAGQGIIPSTPGRVTDFVALLIDRLASRDPRDGSLMTFTTPSREAEGFAAHWYESGVVQEPLERDVTSAIESDGRIVMASRLGLAQLVQDGPNATNQGSFGIPLVLRAPIGIEDHSITERTPLGYAFGTTKGPRLLSPDLVVGHIDEAVERHYSIDGGHVVAIAWDPIRDEITWLDDTIETLRLHPHTGRWGSDTNRTGRDLTLREDGALYILRNDGKVLRQDENTYQDGAVSYAMGPTTPWIREPARDDLAHGGFDFAGVEVFGEYMGPHALTVTVYLDMRDTPVIFQGTIPSGTIAANATAGRDYRYVLYTDVRHCYACKVVVQTSAVPNATARIAGIDVRYNGDGSTNPAQVDDVQRFPLDIAFQG